MSEPVVNRAAMTALGVLSSVAAIAGLCSAASAQPAEPQVVVGEIKGIIGPPMAGYVNRVISDAEQSDAAAVVFYMDTPGGLSDSMHDINSRILSSRVPVVIYVAPDGARATHDRGGAPRLRPACRHRGHHLARGARLRPTPQPLPRLGQDAPATRGDCRRGQPRPSRRLVRRDPARRHPHLPLRRPRDGLSRLRQRYPPVSR